MSKRTTKGKKITKAFTIYTSAEMQAKWQPKPNPDDEYRPAVYKGGGVFDKYSVSTNGVILGQVMPGKRDGLKWAACAPERGEGSVPRVMLCQNGIKQAALVHCVVAFTYIDRVKWNIPQEIVEDFHNCPDSIKQILLHQCFEVDHIDENTWNPNLENLQMILPMDNKRKTMIGNTFAAKNTGDNHWYNIQRKEIEKEAQRLEYRKKFNLDSEEE